MTRALPRHVLLRVGRAALVVLLTYVFTFLVISVLPGDPVTNNLMNPENGFSPDDVQRIVAYYGLDQPVLAQLWTALSRFAVGDLGISLRTQLPVSKMIADVLPSTLALASSALLVALALAFGIAIAVQRLPRRYGQGILRALPSLFLSAPNFIIGLVLIYVFAFQLGIFRVIDVESPWGTFFAAVALGIPVSAQLAEVLIAGLDHESRQEYATVARARGLSRGRLLGRHLLKPTALPVVTVLALTVGELLGGSLITEAVFGRSGVGTLVESAVTSQDTPVLQAVVVLAAVVFVVVNLAADLSYPLLDPRVRVRRRSARASYAPATAEPAAGLEPETVSAT